MLETNIGRSSCLSRRISGSSALSKNSSPVKKVQMLQWGWAHAQPRHYPTSCLLGHRHSRKGAKLVHLDRKRTHKKHKIGPKGTKLRLQMPQMMPPGPPEVLQRGGGEVVTTRGHNGDNLSALTGHAFGEVRFEFWSGFWVSDVPEWPLWAQFEPLN